MTQYTRTPLLHRLYHTYLGDQDLARFAERVVGHYAIGSLERLSTVGDRMSRRAAVLALGLLADYESNAVLGRALSDRDRGVRMLAENGIRAVWCRVGTAHQQERLQALVELNQDHRFREAVDAATRLIVEAEWLAEAWNQRAVAYFNLGRYAQSATTATRPWKSIPTISPPPRAWANATCKSTIAPRRCPAFAAPCG